MWQMRIEVSSRKPSTSNYTVRVNREISSRYPTRDDASEHEICLPTLEEQESGRRRDSDTARFRDRDRRRLKNWTCSWLSRLEEGSEVLFCTLRYDLHFADTYYECLITYWEILRSYPSLTDWNFLRQRNRYTFKRHWGSRSIGVRCLPHWR
jgi:hypothetical protein